MKTTKEAILLTSLHLFARDGYEAVSVSQIAGALGITKGALYRHYQSKRDIFDHILERMEQGDHDHSQQYAMPEYHTENPSQVNQTVSLEDFVNFSKSMFAYWTEDDFASSFRKMLTLEQFRNHEMQHLYQQYLVSGPTEYVKEIFADMAIESPEIKAIQFYSNMHFFYSMYDGAGNKEDVKRQFELTADIIIKELTGEK